jgi:hypothetical protein
MKILDKYELVTQLKLFDAENIKYAGTGFELKRVEGVERDTLILQIIDMIYHTPLKESGAHRQAEWEIGWGENLEKLKVSENASSLVPGYFSVNPICRLGSELYRANSPAVEPALLRVLQIDLLKKFSPNASHVYEFGCGSGNNLFNIREALPGIEITGLDWARSSQAIISQMIKKGLLDHVASKYFNFFEPDYTFDLLPGSTVLTCASLEQIGDKWEAFLKYLLNKSPKIIINIEPISELLDLDNLLDRLSCEYGKRRKYLHGYYGGLLDLARQNKINILHSGRSALGSKYINGYSIVIWEVL